MRVRQTSNELIIQEAPGCLWIFGALFLFVGGVFVYGSLGGFADYETQTAWMPLFAFAAGSLAVAAGTWIIYGAPVTKIVVDRANENVRIERRGLSGRRETIYRFAEIEKFCLVEGKDDEGCSIWYFGMKLSDSSNDVGEEIRITALPTHFEESQRRFVFQINEFMRKQLSATEMIIKASKDVSN